MIKQSRIYRRLFLNAVSYEAEYRADTWLHMFSNALWLGMMAIIIEVIYAHTPAIAGWEKHEVYLLTLLWVIVDEIFTMFVKYNMWNIPDTITDGKLDMYLTRPVGSLFLISTHTFVMRSLYRLLLLHIPVLTWIITRFHIEVRPVYIVAAILVIVCAVIIRYSVSLIINTLSFWFLRIDNINDAWEALNTMGKYPLDVFPKSIRIITLTLIPIAFDGWVSASLLIGHWPWYILLYTLFFTILLFSIARRFWYSALKRYSSASS
ncbi:MAG: ABC-2 family transporter protein [Candidatus Magasanikbacteria bacterium]|nr:ABC-2 family transporter protein [Candidatus Magasanikbacteria bacterium]